MVGACLIVLNFLRCSVQHITASLYQATAIKKSFWDRRRINNCYRYSKYTPSVFYGIETLCLISNDYQVILQIQLALIFLQCDTNKYSLGLYSSDVLSFLCI